MLKASDSDCTIVKYVYGNGLIASYETVADTTEYQSYSYDIRGSVTRISDENGIATSEYLYSTYGQRTVLYGTGASILGYCGRDGVLTDATGLLYMRARYYSTELMRFINEDIIVGDISNSGSLNRYTYVEGNPVTNVDPFGLCAERIENGIWGLFNCAKGGGMAVCGTLAVITGVATIAAGGPFIAMLLAAGAIGAGAYEAICGTADFTEGLQQLYSAVTGKENSAFNFVRDTIFKDNVDEYYLSEALAAGIASNCVGMLSAFQAVAPDPTNSEGGKTTEDIYSFGNKSEPRGARPKQDFGVDDFNDVVGYNGEKFPKGASNVNDVNNAPLSGHYHQLPAGTQLPDGLGIKPDGCDIFPDSPHGPGHSTIYPTKPMTVEEFNSLYKSLPWTYGGKK